MIRIDPKILSDESQRILFALKGKIVGQDRALERLVKSLQKYRSGLNDPRRPLCTLLFMGGTGTGKTQTVHALAEVLFGFQHAITKIDCAELKESHELSKLIGAPPGYVGHKDTGSRLSQTKLDRFQTKDNKWQVNILLFDEIEKAHYSLPALLLGIFEAGRMVMGDGEEVDFSKTIIVMTSNLGSRETEKLIKDAHIGFHGTQDDTGEVDEKIYQLSKAAAKKAFSPEFYNRLDRIIAFRSLTDEHIKKILGIELNKIQSRILEGPVKFIFRVTPTAKKYLIKQGTSPEYGARELKRIVEREIAEPLASLIGSEQADARDIITIDLEDGELVFNKVSDPLLPVATSRQISM